MQQIAAETIEELVALAGASGTCVRDLRAAQRMSSYPLPDEELADSRVSVHDLVHGLLVDRVVASCFARMEGDAMRGAGIAAGDLLVVDRSLCPVLGSVVVAVVEGELLVRRYWPSPFATYLLAAHPDCPPIRIPAEADCQVWGVVTHAIHRSAAPSTGPAPQV
jgi:DNA polymerase V